MSEEELVICLIEMTEELTSGEDWVTEDEIDDYPIVTATIN